MLVSSVLTAPSLLTAKNQLNPLKVSKNPQAKEKLL